MGNINKHFSVVYITIALHYITLRLHYILYIQHFKVLFFEIINVIFSPSVTAQVCFSYTLSTGNEDFKRNISEWHLYEDF